MKINANYPAVFEYVQQHWFKLFLLALVLYLFTKKDFSFSIKLSDPAEQEQPLEEGNGHQATQKKSYVTEKTSLKQGMLDRLSLSPFKNRTATTSNRLPQIEESIKHDYLKRFAKVVIEERRKFGIPSSVLLATALLHSQAGERSIASTANNHFAIRCSADWTGPISQQSGTCYRKYENAWMSFRDNSLYLSTGKFAALQSIDATNYQAWAKQLEAYGYSDFDNFAAQIIDLIQLYGLDELDRR